MNQKVTLRTYLLLAISIFLLKSCATTHGNLNRKVQQIIDLEIKRNAYYLDKPDLINSNKILFKELSDIQVIEFIKKISKKTTNEFTTQDVKKVFGNTNLEQLAANIDSINISLSKEVMDAINAVHAEIPNPAP